jgi:Tfp pilus assembly protein PilO
MSLWSRIYGERRAILLPLVAGLIGNVAILVLAVLPLGRSVDAAQAEVLQARGRLAQAKRQAQQLVAANDRRKHADEELRTFYGTILPRDFAHATRTTNLWLQQAARQAGLRFQASHFESKEVRESRLVRAQSTVTLLGRYPDIRRFLAAMETAPEFVVVEQVELAQTGNDAPTADSQLEIALAVATYFLAGPAQ